MNLKWLFIASIFITSCRVIHTNYDRAHSYNGSQAVIDKGTDDIENTVSGPTIISPDLEEVQLVPEQLEETPFNIISENDNFETPIISPAANSKKNKITRVSDKEEIHRTALKAEGKALMSVIFGSIGLVFWVLFPPVGLILSMVSLACFAKGNKSRYSTPRGEKLLNASKIILILSAICCLAALGIIILYLL